jgi:DMSO/TMAO reductase YedYZ heme-binding membrane subunit
VINWRIDFFLGGGVDYDIEHCHFFSYFLLNLQLNIGKKYLKTAKIIDESLILAIVLRDYSTKPSYIFQLKRELKVWKYIFNLFHFEMLIQNRNPKFRSLSLFVLTFNEYEANNVLILRAFFN